MRGCRPAVTITTNALLLPRVLPLPLLPLPQPLLLPLLLLPRCCRYEKLLTLVHSVNGASMLVGGPGTAKTATINQFLGR